MTARASIYVRFGLAPVQCIHSALDKIRSLGVGEMQIWDGVAEIVDQISRIFVRAVGCGQAIATRIAGRQVRVRNSKLILVRRLKGANLQVGQVVLRHFSRLGAPFVSTSTDYVCGTLLQRWPYPSGQVRIAAVNNGEW